MHVLSARPSCAKAMVCMCPCRNKSTASGQPHSHKCSVGLSVLSCPLELCPSWQPNPPVLCCTVGIQKSKAVLAEGRSKTETISLNAIPYLLTWFWSQHLHVGVVHHHTAVVPAVKEALSCTQPALRRVLRGGLAWHGAKHPKYLQQE